MTFLGSVVVPPGIPFTEKPFADIIRADIKIALTAKETRADKIFEKNGKTWTRKVGGKIIANRLHDHLRAMWNWATDPEVGYQGATPFLRTRKVKNRPKHDEVSRDRRLREGEEASLLEHANPHLNDVVITALG